MIKVLIVEDDPMVLEVNKSFLGKLPGFQLIANASTGKEAIEIIKNGQIDLVLLDIYLPDISGAELLSNIRNINIPVDVIAITAARDAETVHQLFRLGTIDYLVKPFHFERFKFALENYARFWHKLKNTQLINQDDIDSWIDQNSNTQTELLPKGLSEITLKQIMMVMLKQNDPITAEQLAQYLGLARVTVRRYLEYLEKQDRIKVKMAYGRVGRPTHYYFL